MTNERTPPGKPFGADFLGLGPMDMGKTGAEAMMKMQGEFMSNLQSMSQAWLAHTQATASLVTYLMRQLSGARSAPETMAAYQQFLSRRMEMMVEDSRYFFSNSEKMMDAAAKMLTHGLPNGSGNPASGLGAPGGPVEDLAERRRERESLRSTDKSDEKP